MSEFRKEVDLLGERDIPADVYWEFIPFGQSKISIFPITQFPMCLNLFAEW